MSSDLKNKKTTKLLGLVVNKNVFIATLSVLIFSRSLNALQ